MGCKHFFVLWGEGVLLTVCPRGRGVGVTCPGDQGIFDPYWGGLIKALTCPGGRGALTPCVSWGWRGLKKNVAPPEDNFWNSPKVKATLGNGHSKTLPQCFDFSRHFPKSKVILLVIWWFAKTVFWKGPNVLNQLNYKQTAKRVYVEILWSTFSVCH